MKSSIWRMALVALGRISWRTSFDSCIAVIGVCEFPVPKNPFLSIFASLKNIVWPPNTKYRTHAPTSILTSISVISLPASCFHTLVVLAGLLRYQNPLLKSHHDPTTTQITMNLSASHLLFVHKQIDNVTPSKFLLKSHSRKIWGCEDQRRLVISPRQPEPNSRGHGSVLLILQLKRLYNPLHATISLHTPIQASPETHHQS